MSWKRGIRPTMLLAVLLAWSEAGAQPFQASGGMLLAENEAVASSIEEQLYFSRDELITGTSKREVKLDEAPANVTIITQDQIIQSGAKTLAEVFRRVPGMDVVMITDAETRVSIRGFANSIMYGERLAVLIDGRTFYHEFLSGTIWAQIPVPLSDIKRIEVIKGPLSELYGNKAMLGVINIVTFKPEETRTELAGNGGQYHQLGADFVNAGQFSEGYWYKVTGHYLRYDRYTDFLGDGRKKSSANFSATGKFQAQPVDEFKAILDAGVTQIFGIAQFGGISRFDETRTYVDGRAEYDMGEWGKLDVQSFWERHYLTNLDFPLPNTVVDNVDTEIRHAFGVSLGEHAVNTLVYGFNYRFADCNQPTTQVINNYAGFLQDELRLYDKVIINGGARVDYQQNFAGLNVSAHGSVVWLAHPIYTFRVGVGSAFTTPNYIQYNTEIAQAVVPIAILRGNPNLKAEKILYFDLNNTIRPTERIAINAAAFYYRMNNMITPTVGVAPPGVPTVQYRNDGGAEGMGGEISLDIKLAEWLSGYANWSYEQFSPINGNLNPTPNLGNPRNKVGAGLTGKWLDKRLTANVDFFYVQKHKGQNGAVNTPLTPVVDVDASYLLNIRLGAWPIKDRLELAVAANNVLNNRSAQIPEFDPAFNVVMSEKPRVDVWGSVRYVF